jgi:hypothetical protein
VEALVDEQWLAADMRSAERPGESDSGTSGAGAATDKRGRVWGVAG